MTRKARTVVATAAAARRRPVLLTAAGAAGMALCWLPLGWAPAMPLAILLVLRGLRAVDSPRQAVLCGIVFGAVRYAVAAHFLLWLMRYSIPGGLAFYLLAIAFILPFGILEFWGAYTLEKRFGLRRAFGLALLYPLLEKVRSVGDASFPADLLAHAFGTAPAWLAWSDWIGPFGLSLMAFAVACLLDLALEHRARPAWAAALVAGALGLWSAAPARDALVGAPASAAAESLRVGIVQPVVGVAEKLDRGRWPILWDRLRDLTRDAATGSDLVVWPETARPGPLLWHEGEPLRDEPMQALANEVGVPILYGCEIAKIRRDGGVGALYNGAALVAPGSTAVEWYGKQRLLPFAEGVPFARWIGWDPAERRREPGRRSVLSLLGNFSPGPRPTVFSVGPARIGALICYEGMYPSLGARYRLAGANALFVLTNDAWWGDSLFAPWHARMMASQARSLDVPVLRAANSGVSSSADRRGRMTGSSALHERTTLRVRLAPSPAPPTFFARNRNLLPWSLALVLGAVVAAPWTARLARRARQAVAWRTPSVPVSGSRASAGAVRTRSRR